MEEFNIIYHILRILQKGMDNEEFDSRILSAEALGMTVPKWSRIMAILISEGYITGAEAWNSFVCSYPKVVMTRLEITLKGLEYLEENTMMKKVARIAKGIKEAVPGL